MYVAFKKNTTSFYGKIIQLWTGGKYCHSELVFSDGDWFSSDEVDNGTRFFKGPKADCQYDYVHVPTNSYAEAMVKDFCKSEDGLKYDKKGIGFSFLPIPLGYQSEDKWFCSEVCVAGLQVGGYCRGYTPARVHPNKLYKILNKELTK